MKRILILFILSNFLNSFVQSIFIETQIIEFLKYLFWALVLEILIWWILTGLERNLGFVEVFKCWGVLLILFLLYLHYLFTAWIYLWYKLKRWVYFLLFLFKLFSSEIILYFYFVCICVKTIENIWIFFRFYFFLRFRNIRMKGAIRNLNFRFLLSILFL